MTAAARREQLLDVTTEIVSDQGFQAVTIESVARRAGISRPIVYEHFGDLRGLLEAIVGREMARALSQISETTLTDLTEGPPRELMLESLRAYLYAVRDHPTTWRLVLMPPEGAPELLRKSINRGRAAVLDRLTQAVRPALSRDRQSPDAELTARVLSAISDEYARLVLIDPDRFPPERLLVHARWCIDQVSL
jgi:AcrR family transcriptional regulator